jgi:hypothetical protein
MLASEIEETEMRCIAWLLLTCHDTINKFKIYCIAHTKKDAKDISNTNLIYWYAW